MYNIYCDNELIFDLSSDISLISPILKLQDNNAGTLEFSIVPDNIIYDKIKKMKSEIKVFSDGKPIFEGRPIDETVDFKNCKKVMCEGALAYLNDSIQRPAEYHNLTIRAYLETLINYHNQQVSDSRLQFKIGIVTVHDDNDSIYKYTNWETTLQVIKTDLVDKYGGHLRVRIEGDTKYLDYLKDYPRTNTQVIEFGTNLLDFTKNIDATQIVTAVIPLGARLEESSIKKLEERVTIKSVNDNLDYIASKAAVDTYGWIFKTVTWDNVHKPLILKHKAEEYLKSIQFEKVVLKVKAIDLHMVNVDIEQIHLLDEIRVISKPNGLDKVFPVSEMTIDMTNPQANTITLGQTVIQAMSGSAVSNNEEIKKRIDELPSVDDAVQEAVKNATEMLNNALNGHVVKRKDELLIMDTADVETAKKVWRWNLNGLAYSNNGYGGPYEMAMTMDGSIVANRITTGILKGGFVKFDLTRGTFLIGRNDQDFLLKFDGEKLQFGNGTLKKDALEKELLESLKGKDGKSFKYNLISNGDFHIDFTKDEPGHNSKVLNRWQAKSRSDVEKMYIKKPSGKSWVALEVNATDTIEINQYLDLKKNTKYYIKATIASEEMKLYYYGSHYSNITSVKDNYDHFTTINMSFTTHDSDTHFIQLDCKKKTTVRDVIISEEPISNDTEWYPSKFDGIGQDGKPGRDGRDGERGAQGPPGRDGRDGSMVDLPPALKDWSGKATEISGKYVFTPELFVGTNGDSKYSRTGIYMGSGIKARDLFDNFTTFDGITGINNGTATWHLSVNGNGWIGNSQRAMWWNKDGELTLPKVKAREIEAGAITTDMLYPGNNNRIVLERGYSPGDNNCMSVDTNVDSEGTKCLRLKVDAGTYLRLTKKAAFSLLSNGSQVFHFDPRQQYDLEFFGDRGRGIGKFNMYDAYLEAKCYIGQVARMGIVTYEMQWSTSDRRLKTDIEYLSQSMTSKLINFIKNVDIAEFYYKSDKEKDHKQISVIAQDIIKEFPDLKNYIVNEVGEYYTVNSNNINFATIVTLQEEMKKREALEDKVGELEEELISIKKLLKERGVTNVKEPESN